MRCWSANIFFDRAGRDHTVDEDGPALADAMRPVDGLGLDRRIPPWIIEDHGVGGGEVEPGATSLEADQDQRHLARLKARDRRLAVFALAGQFDPAVPQSIKFGLDQVEHRGELAKQGDPPPLGDQFVD